jgi:hypothetical protein
MLYRIVFPHKSCQAHKKTTMTKTAAADDTLRIAAEANALERTTLEKADGTYKSTWKNYKEWIKAELKQTEPPFLDLSKY